MMGGFAWALVLLAFVQSVATQRSFTVCRKRKSFLMDGEPFRYVSGSLHYFRIPQEYWRDRLRKVRAAGLNAIQVYVEWSYHEPELNHYEFQGQKDIARFIQMAHEEDLFVLLRPGPFIDAERDMGGLPYWLLHDNPNMKLRTADPTFLKFVDKWFGELMSKLKSSLYINGGNILMVQSENEYGSYALQTKHTDTKYLIHMRDLLRSHLGSDVLIYSTDGCADGSVRNSITPGVYSTVDFGPNSEAESCFKIQRHFEPDGPLVNSEFYPGWLDHWSKPHSTTATKVVAIALDKMLAMGANVNIYMLHGGTSFGFRAGSNSGPFLPTPTSYDYNAPINEAGDLTDKYFAIKAVVGKYLPVPDIMVNASSPKGNYGEVFLASLATLQDLSKASVPAYSKWPITFEAIGQSSGLLMYETKIPADSIQQDPALLQIKGIRDRGYVYVDGQRQGILSRMGDIHTMPLSIIGGQKLQIIVENQGRICFGPEINDFKGITSNVTLSGKVLKYWRMTPFPLSEAPKITKKQTRHLRRNHGSMTFWEGQFKIPCSESSGKDTFLDMSTWGKGVAFINGFNLGRYWPRIGPQVTLYVPGIMIKGNCQENTVIIFEQDKAPLQAPKVRFVTEPQINGPTPTQTYLG